MEKPSQHIHTVGYWWTIADLDYYATYIDRLRAVTRQEVQAYVNKWIIGRPSITGLLRSTEMRDQVKLTNEVLVS